MVILTVCLCVARTKSGGKESSPISFLDCRWSEIHSDAFWEEKTPKRKLMKSEFQDQRETYYTFYQITVRNTMNIYYYDRRDSGLKC